MIPIATLITWLIFRKNKFNFWEHILMNTYMAAQLNNLIIITQLAMLIRWLATGNKNYNLTLFITGFMAYYAFTFSKLMLSQTKSWVLGIKLGLICFLLAASYATAMIFSGIIS